jgi:hypothetical protein
MANIVVNDMVNNDNEKKDVDSKEVLADQSAVDSEPPKSKKRIALERVILCVALFFPLFLATLDTSIPL